MSRESKRKAKHFPTKNDTKILSSDSCPKGQQIHNVQAEALSSVQTPLTRDPNKILNISDPQLLHLSNEVNSTHTTHLTGVV